ncbi:MAG: response regulator receiver protein [Rhodoferax sp.]|nr:response regulator receiver protein [Rhodoferax sp.]
MKPVARLPAVLLIEPQFVLRRTVVVVGRELGLFEFVEATSVAKALPLLAARAFSGIVLDLDDGGEALALLAQLRTGTLASRADVPVVTLSHGTDAALDQKLSAFGPLVKLRKPFKVRELLESVSAMGRR